ncbi:uncharacterized protein HaLaN_07961 [Haematococcus lacustris]|uniref:Radical SAM core domain-containing protein n=1 Tax=Haematococcus lacustris TaxID=44745 RepID=A0A699YZX3_HAELA|nr:uncharacterized protein HaLaN_07961 [Haematococcus lacustris]
MGSSSVGLMCLRIVAQQLVVHLVLAADRLVQACAELTKLCEFFHIPFQSGDNDILREMKRGYSHERYRAIIDNIRRYMPDASISGDAIVGFPGETEEQYLRTEALVRDIGFDRVNTAAYSPRPNTPAGAWDNQGGRGWGREKLGQGQGGRGRSDHKGSGVRSVALMSA